MENSRDAAGGLDQARQTALDHWRTLQGGACAADPEAVAEAAALAKVIDSAEGPRFDEAAFDELVEFVAALPF